MAVYGGRDGDRVVRIDSRTNRIAANVPVEGDPYELAAGEGSVWVMGNSEEHGDVLHRIDPRTKPGWWRPRPFRATARIRLARIKPHSSRVAVGRDAVWVLTHPDTVRERPWDMTRVDPETSRAVATELCAGLCEPARDRWRPLPDLPLRFSECYPASARVGEIILAWYCGQAALLDVGSRSWRQLRTPESEIFGSPVSTGLEVLFPGASTTGAATRSGNTTPGRAPAGTGSAPVWKPPAPVPLKRAVIGP